MTECRDTRRILQIAGGNMSPEIVWRVGRILGTTALLHYGPAAWALHDLVTAAPDVLRLP